VELIARVRSQLRRYTTLGGAVKRTDVYTCGGIELDDRAKTVTVDGAPVSLTPTEFDILRLFLQHPGVVISPKDNPWIADRRAEVDALNEMMLSFANLLRSGLHNP
jgi:DNA-binding response OmpR family regulator